MNANSQLPVDTLPPAAVTFENAPVPNAKPASTKSMNAATFSAASTFIITRPGPTPRM